MKKKQYRDIAPEEIFLDAENLPRFDIDRFEGRIERPVGRAATLAPLFAFLALTLFFGGQLWRLQIDRGEAYFAQSEENRLERDIVFASRGAIFDRTGVVLASNAADESGEDAPQARRYAEIPGIAHILGYVSHPKKDSSGFYFQETVEGRDGIELSYNAILSGENGERLTEVNARGETLSQSVVRESVDGGELRLTIDARLQEKLYETMYALADDAGFTGGAAVLLDATNGATLALASFPEYDPQALSDGAPRDTIAETLSDPRNPFLNRAIAGRYAPGSIIKPFLAAGALDLGTISSETQIYSSGALTVPNVFDPGHPSVFKDWKAHGWVDMRRALAVSSNVYFFELGGGFESQKGLGIENIEKYARLFGIGSQTGIDLPGEVDGVIPSVAWKTANFPGDPWRVGDTYNTAIGQYGFQVTPIQMARAVAAVANGGALVAPHFLLGDEPPAAGRVLIAEEDVQVVREGMRLAVEEGTAAGLNIPQVAVAAKTGTAEVGDGSRVSSWVIGFFPYEHPRYAFAAVMENGPAHNLIGATYVMRQLLDWMTRETPEYLQT